MWHFDFSKIFQKIFILQQIPVVHFHYLSFRIDNFDNYWGSKYV